MGSMDDRSVSLNYYLSKEYRDPPKAFWKYYEEYKKNLPKYIRHIIL